MWSSPSSGNVPSLCRLWDFALIGPSTFKGPHTAPPKKPSFPAQGTPTLLPSDSFGTTLSTFLFSSPARPGLVHLPKLSRSTHGLGPRPSGQPLFLRDLGSGSYSGLKTASHHWSTRCQCGLGTGGREARKAEGQGQLNPILRAEAGPGDCVIPSTYLWGRCSSGCLSLGGSGLDASPTWKSLFGTFRQGPEETHVLEAEIQRPRHRPG